MLHIFTKLFIELLRLTRPHGIGNAPDKLQLLTHVLVAQRVTLRVRRESTLRTDAALLDSVLTRLTGALRNPFRGLVDARNHIVLVF